MHFKPIDISQWNRREYFEHYLNQVPCSYSMTLNLDLTELLKEIKKRDIKLYPTMIYLLSMVVNRHEEFRMAIDKDAGVGVFDFTRAIPSLPSSIHCADSLKQKRPSD